MAALVPIKVLGYSQGDPVLSVEMNLINTQIVKAPNFVDGGATYDIAAELQIGGAGLRFNTTTDFSSGSTTVWESGSTGSFLGTLSLGGTTNVPNAGIVSVNSGGLLRVQSGGTITVNNGGTATWVTGASLNAQSGSTVSIGGVLSFGASSTITGTPSLATGATLETQAGATVTLRGLTTFADAEWPRLDPARSWTRRNLRICGTTTTARLNGDVDAEINLVLSVGTQGPVATLREGGSLETWFELDDLPEGATISQVVMRTAGDATPGSITTPARYKVVRWQGESAPEDMSATTNDSHTTVNWSTFTNQTIAITNHSTIDRSYRYAVVVKHHDTDTGAPTLGGVMFVCDVIATGTATRIRV